MAEQALSHLPNTGPSAGPFPSPLHLFAGVLLLADAASPQVNAAVAASLAEARAAVAAGRATTADGEVLRFGLCYRALKQRVVLSRAPATPDDVRWRRVIAGLGALRHRQRAALTLYYCVGLSLDDVASVIGVGEPEARRVVEAGIAALLRALKEPLDARRALRAAGMRLVVEPEWPFSVGPGPRPAAAAARMPRPVVRLLLADPPSREEPATPPELVPAPAALPTPSPGAGTASSSPAAPTEPSHGAAVRRSSRPRRSRLLLAAALGVLLVLALSPARGERPAPAPAFEPPAVRSQPIVGSRIVPSQVSVSRAGGALAVIAVQRGDSLWAIAERVTGDGARWVDLWRTNQSRAFSGAHFSDPDLIIPGWRLRLPREWALLTPSR